VTAFPHDSAPLAKAQSVKHRQRPELGCLAADNPAAVESGMDGGDRQMIHFDFAPSRSVRAGDYWLMHTISPEKLKEGYLAFQQKERRDAMYKTATFLVEHFWGKHTEVAEGLGVLLCVWNHAFYRNGPFDYDLLEKCIASNQTLLTAFRKRNILTYSPDDDRQIKPLFQEFLEALRICEGKCKGRGTPVGVAKALHLLAPGFFPLWDEKIARAYDCYYTSDPPGQYMAFVVKTKPIAEALATHGNVDSKTLLKLIDEYNYAKYTKGWV
jgi:hypothetical protein